MIELSLGYWNELASQIIFISALLCGCSLTVMALFLDDEDVGKPSRRIFRAAVLSTLSFLVSIFSMTRILMMTTTGFPFVVTDSEIMFPKLVGILTFLMGIISIVSIVILSGWLKSKSMGRFTTLVGVIALILIFLMLT